MLSLHIITINHRKGKTMVQELLTIPIKTTPSKKPIFVEDFIDVELFSTQFNIAKYQKCVIIRVNSSLSNNNISKIQSPKSKVHHNKQ